jgi:ferredoxin
MMRITTDLDRCMANGACVAACPEVFRQDEHGLVQLVTAEPEDGLLDSVLAAEAACPTLTITVET